MRICKWCNKEKDESDFYERSPGHPRPECRACTLAVKKERWDNPDWQPKCYRCQVPIERTGVGGKRLCPECYGGKYVAGITKSTGRHQLRLKPCNLCGAERETAPQERSGLCHDCSSFGKAGAVLMRRFGVTPNEYRAMLAAQGGVCYICQKPPKKGLALAIDHDHRTGQIRGLLHAGMQQCNHRLGVMRENASWFRRAADYLESPPAIEVLGKRYIPGSLGAAGLILDWEERPKGRGAPTLR